MFYNSTTLHRVNRESAFTGRENRLLNYSMEEFRIDKIKTKYFFGGLKKWMGRLSWAFGGPIIWKALSLGAKGIGYGVKAANWTYETAKEGLYGLKDMTLKPPYRLGGASVSYVKRMRFWEVPKASLKAMFKSPAAVVMSPWNFIKGCREAIFDTIPKNYQDIRNGVSEGGFKGALGAMRGTRNMIWDLLTLPGRRAIGPILSPMGDIGMEMGSAFAQLGVGTRQAIEDTIGGAKRIINAPHVATENWKMGIARKEQLKDMKMKAQLQQREEEYAKAGLPPVKPKIDTKAVEGGREQKGKAA